MFSRLAHRARPRKRAWLILTTFVQAALVMIAASTQWLIQPSNAASATALLIVALLSFAASGQTSVAVTIGLAELNTTMVTGAIVSGKNPDNTSHVADIKGSS